MTAHAKLGASGSKKWMHCHPALVAEHHYPNVDSVYSAEGTVAHMVCEEGLKEGKPASHFIGRYGDGHADYKDEPLYFAPKKRSQFEFEVTAEMARAVQLFLDTVNTEFEVWQLQGLNPLLNVEVGFSLEKVMDRDDMFGTNDASIFVPGHYLGVFDYKHGRGELVEVEDNSQLKYYALGALLVLCWDAITETFDEDKMPERIELVIVQPRASHANGPVRRWEVDPTALIEDFVAEMKEDAAAIEKLYELVKAHGDIDYMSSQAIMDVLPVEEFAPGEWCKWCKAKPLCKGLYREGQKALAKDFAEDGLSLEEFGDLVDNETKDLVNKSGKNKGAPNAKAVNAKTKEIASNVVGQHFPEMDGERLKRLLNAAGLLEIIAKSLRQHAYNQVTQGAKIPGYKLVRQGTKRRWLDGPKDEIVETLALFGIGEDKVYKPREIVSFTDIEELSKEAAELVVGLTDQPEGALVLAKESDKRPAVVPSAKDAFEGDELDASDFE